MILTDLKMRKCRGCEKIMIGTNERSQYSGVSFAHLNYCEECHEKYQRPEYKREWYDN